MHFAHNALKCASAREALTRRLHPRVQRLVASFLQNRADAEDAAQVALLEILRAIASYRGESRLEAWADRIAVRTAIKFARTRRLTAVRQEVLEPDDLPSPTRAESHDEELPRALAVYLAALPEARRTVLVLRHALGYSIQEIAELTHCSENTVKDRLLAARHEVRRMVRRDVGRGKTHG